jgi:NADPH:quinone reductase-like Zn-dependent oxidoreductase
MKTKAGTRKTYRIGERAGEIVCHEEQIPALGANDVLIEVRAISLNYRDLLYIDSEPVSSGLIPGSDLAGVVVEIGEGVREISLGERVMPSFFTEWVSGRYDPGYRMSALGGGKDGTFASHVILPESCLVKLPETMSYHEAACLPCAGVTAWNALLGRSKLQCEDFVLIQGTGGVSLFAIQLALAVGANPIVISSSGEKISLLSTLGVRHTINYRQTPSWEDAVLECTSGRGVDNVVEVIGGSSISRSIRCLRPGGTISYIGCLGGLKCYLDPMELMYKNGTLQAIYVGARADLEQTCNAINAWNISPVIEPQRFTFDDLPHALELMRRGGHVGKIVVDGDSYAGV